MVLLVEISALKAGPPALFDWEVFLELKSLLGVVFEQSWAGMGFVFDETKFP